QPAQSSTCRTSLRGDVSEPLNHSAGPLAVEIRRVHQHFVALSEIPGSGNNAAMPESVNMGRQIGTVIAARFLTTEYLESNCRTEYTNHGPHSPADHGNQ